jgi:hypothetical protein
VADGRGGAPEAKRQAKAAEAAKWLSYEHLQISGDYSGCSRLPVDAKNTEDWLNGEDFDRVVRANNSSLKKSLKK